MDVKFMGAAHADHEKGTLAPGRPISANGTELQGAACDSRTHHGGRLPFPDRLSVSKSGLPLRVSATAGQSFQRLQCIGFETWQTLRDDIPKDTGVDLIVAMAQPVSQPPGSPARVVAAATRPLGPPSGKPPHRCVPGSVRPHRIEGHRSARDPHLSHRHTSRSARYYRRYPADCPRRDIA